MVFGSDSQSLICRVEARSFSNGPAQKNAIKFKPKIIVKTSSIVLLDEIRKPVGAGVKWAVGRGLRRFLKVAFPTIFFERHFQPPL
jgi:hypothetical protein